MLEMFARTRDDGKEEEASEEEVKKKLDARKAAEEKKQFDALNEEKEKKRVEKLTHSLRAIIGDPESQGAISLNALMEYNDTCGKKVKEYEVLQKEEERYQEVMNTVILRAVRRALGIVGDTTSVDDEFEDAVETEEESEDAVKADTPKEEVTACRKFSQERFAAAVKAEVDAKVKKKTDKLRKQFKERLRDAMKILKSGSTETEVEFVHTPLTNLFLPLRM